LSIERQNVLLTGGRAFATLELARHLARHGHRVVGAESMPIHLCRYSRYVAKHYRVPAPNVESGAFIDALVAIVQREKIDVLIPTCEEIFFVAQGLERLRPYCRVLCASFEQLMRLHSKWEFIQSAARYGLLVPKTHLFTSNADLQQFLQEHGEAFVLKPVFSRFASKVVFSDAMADQIAQLPITQAYPWVAQERIDGEAFCSYSIVSNGKLLAHAVYPVRYRAGLGSCIYFAPIEHAAIDEWITRFLQHERFSGQIAFDLIVTPDGTVYPIECNPRATSGLHLFQPDQPLYRALLAPGDHVEPMLQPPLTNRAMIAIAMLVYGLPSLGSWAQMRAWLCALLRARDVVFDWRDPLPFLLQPLLLWYNWKESRKRSISILEFSTYDIEWNGSSKVAR
jgi:predicted ATP-grasp superfamily ATP-dependent carboligase